MTTVTSFAMILFARADPYPAFMVRVRLDNVGHLGLHRIRR